MRQKNYSLLVFDWDGTLVDSESLAIEAIQKSAADCGYQIPPKNFVKKQFGLCLNGMLQQIFPEKDHALLTQTFFKHFTEEKLAKNLFANTTTTLEHLKQQGFILAIATNRPRKNLELALNTANIEHFFVATRCADDASPKPDPKMLLELLEELDHEPHDTLMIGDSVFDMQFANNAKVDALAACHDQTNKEQLKTFNPVGCIHNMDELKNFLA